MSAKKQAFGKTDAICLKRNALPTLCLSTSTDLQEVPGRGAKLRPTLASQINRRSFG